MKVQLLRLKRMDEDHLTQEVLDKFVNSHEQTYEEFLSSFTYLSKEDDGTKREAFGTNSSEKIFPLVKFTRENERNDHRCLRNKTTFLHTCSQCSEEQIVMDEGQTLGSSLQGDLSQARRMKVHSVRDVEDVDVDEEIKPPLSKDLLLLPGEVEQDIDATAPPCVPSMGWSVTPHVKPQPTGGADTEEVCEDEVQSLSHDEGDEVEPFCLDEEFDYDSVTLTPKFTPVELGSIKELSNQKRENCHIDSEETCD